ncbi:histidine phosphatase family protein [Pseudomonadota bacterium]
MLYIIRHGETEWNVKRLVQGKKDSKLTEKGIGQAKDIAKLLHKINKEMHNYKFIISTLGRTKQTFEVMKQELGINTNCICEPLLEEISFGIFEGITRNERLKKFPKEVELNEQDIWHLVYPEGESRAMLAERLKTFIKKYKNIENKIVITHNAVSIVLRGILNGQEYIDILNSEHTHRQDELYCWDGIKMEKFIAK